MLWVRTLTVTLPSKIAEIPVPTLCVDRSTAISTRVKLLRLFLLIRRWESQRLIPKRSAGPRATKIGVVSLKALDHHRPNREESASSNNANGAKFGSFRLYFRYLRSN